MKRTGKFISALLAVMMVVCTFSALSFSASAAETNTIEVSSNICDTASYSYDENSSQVTVTYYLQSSYLIVAQQAKLTYSSNVSVSSDTTADTCVPVFGSDAVVVFKDGAINFNASNVSSPYNFKTKAVFFTATFDIIGDGAITFDLNVPIITATTAAEGETAAQEDDIDLVYYDSVESDKFTFTCEADVASGDATLYVAAPVFKEGTTWDDIYLTYSSSSNVSSATKIAMTKTDNYYYVSGSIAGSLSSNTNWAVYKVTLTEEQVEAIDAASYAGFTNYYNNYRTNYIWANSIFRAKVDESGYQTAKTSVADLSGKMFVIDGATTLENKMGFTGNWVSSTGSPKAATIYTASPVVDDSTSMGDVYFRYGTSSTVSAATQIRMMSTHYLYTAPTPDTAMLQAGEWTVYQLDLTEEQADAIDSCNYTGFTSSYGGEVRTYFTYSYSVTKAKVGSYSATYNSSASSISDLDGKMFFITNSVSQNTISYLGYWGDYDADIETVTIKVAVPETVGTKTVDNLQMAYSDDFELSDAAVIDMTKTDETFTPDATYSDLISSSASWAVYEVTLDADQIDALADCRRCGFMTEDGKVTTDYSWSGNVTRAGVGSYEDPYDTTSTASLFDLDGATFVICGSTSSVNTQKMTGYWKTN